MPSNIAGSLCSITRERVYICMRGKKSPRCLHARSRVCTCSAQTGRSPLYCRTRWALDHSTRHGTPSPHYAHQSWLSLSFTLPIRRALGLSAWVVCGTNAAPPPPTGLHTTTSSAKLGDDAKARMRELPALVGAVPRPLYRVGPLQGPLTVDPGTRML